MITYTIKNTTMFKNFIIGYNENDPNHFFVQAPDRKQCVYVEHDPEYAFKLMKTKIKACEAAKGLFNFISMYDEMDFHECNIAKILFHVLNTMKYTNR